ncbi:MAG TPA: response regulator [Nitrospirota bacterium]|nr:response regulator [Nitrospirota bacterium]
MIKRKKILVVDDDEMHLRVTKEILRDENIEVVTHQCGFGVMALASEFQPDLLLIDVNMPALSGDKLASLLRTNEYTRNIEIVFYSSDDEESLREIVKSCNVRGYICKGDIVDLKNKVNHYLRSPA